MPRNFRDIYVYGDSHRAMFGIGTRFKNVYAIEPPGTEINFRVLSFGANSAFGLYKEDIWNRKILDQFTKKGDEIWFVFGEIDGRAYINRKHVEEGISVEESIDIVIKSYLDYVEVLIKDGYNISIVSVVPPCRTEQIKPHARGPVFPLHSGTDAERKYIVETFNQRLKEDCLKRKIVFVDIYKFLVDPNDGYNNRELATDGYHYKYVGDLVVAMLNLKPNET